MSEMKMKILITGATGFIGRHLVGALSKIYTVRCLVRKNSDITPLRELKVDIVYGDLLDKDSILPALDGIELVYHLAGEVYSRKKNDYYKGNVLATVNLLEACKRKYIKRIIFLSSVGIYKPVATNTLLTEESECGPITYYGKTKLDAEELIKKCDISWVIVRAPVTYGPYQTPVLNKFFLDGMNKKKIYFIGDGNNFRSLCFIDNLVQGLGLLANKPEVDRKTYILSDSTPYTFNEMIETAYRVIRRQVEVAHLPNFLGDISWKIYRLMDNVFNLCPVELYAIKKMQLHEGYDITKAKKEIGYNPTITLEMGFEKTVNWIRNYKMEGTLIRKRAGEGKCSKREE
jgi:nucleoside-diphosphate-sugar epimerase